MFSGENAYGCGSSETLSFELCLRLSEKGGLCVDKMRLTSPWVTLQLGMNVTDLWYSCGGIMIRWLE